MRALRLTSLPVLALVVVASLASSARAQDTAPPAPLDPPAPIDPAAAPDAPTPAPLAPEAPPAPLAPPTPPPDARAAPAPDARPAEGCAWAPTALAGLGGFGFGGGLGGIFLCVGGAMAATEPESNNEDCAEACFETAVLIVFVAAGVVIGVVGVILLGPVAAIAATVGAAGGASGAGRKAWPSIAGGSLGIAVAIAGAGLFAYGLAESDDIPYVAGTPYDDGDPLHVAIVGGVALCAASGLVSLGGAVVADALFGGPDEEHAP